MSKERETKALEVLVNANPGVERSSGWVRIPRFARSAVVIAVFWSGLSDMCRADEMGRWSFDKNSGTIAFDSSGNGNDGTLTSDAIWCGPGYNGSGSAVCLPGDSSLEYVTMPSSASLDFNGRLYLSAWVKFVPISTYSAVICKGTSQTVYALALHPDGMLNFIGNWPAGSQVSAETDPGDVVANDGLFHHIEALYDQVRLSLYIDGELKKSVPFSAPLVNNTQPLYIGYDPPGTPERFEGTIDEVLISTVKPCDDFEDGVIDPALWVAGGNPDLGTGGGSWAFSHDEILDTDGFLKMRVWGPTSGGSHGAEAWVRTQYDYNDGLNYVINFRWGADVNASHVDMYAVQITDGTIPGGSDVFWYGSGTGGTDGAGWTNLYFQYVQPDFGPADWSIHIDGQYKIASIFDGPDLSGTARGQKALPAGQAWNIRFILSDATSSGFPPGDNLLNIYDFCSDVSNAVSPIPTLSEWSVVAMTLLLMTAGTIVFARRRKPSLG